MKNLISAVVLLVLVSACGSKTSSEAGEELSREDAVKMEQYTVAGEILYAQYCANCHQPDGNGLAELYPPLNNSDYLQEHLAELPCIIKQGKQGELVVNGVTYNQVMPGLAMLTDLEIAEISTYVANSWENELGYVGVTTVSSQLEDCK